IKEQPGIVNLVDKKYDNTPLGLAVEIAKETGKAEIVDLLLKSGAKIINLKEKEDEDSDLRNYLSAFPNHNTPFQKAIKNGNLSVIKFFLDHDHGADVGQVDQENKTPLHWAIENGADIKVIE